MGPCNAAIVLFGVASIASANLVGIEFKDIANPALGTGGPHWTGVVNTTTDTLSIYSWNELPGSGEEFWTPRVPNLSGEPLVWHALQVDPSGVSPTGVPYDVPDNFGANGVVTIDSSWGFVSPVSANDMAWVDGDYSRIVDFFPGWGAQLLFLGPDVTLTLKAGLDPGEQASELSAYDETSLPVWPISVNNVDEVRPVANATVRVIDAQNAISAAVPELTAFGPLALLALWQAAVSRRALRLCEDG